MQGNRQLEILLYLLKVKNTTHRELSTEFGVSVKTIQRDIDKLSALGVPVTCKQGNGGGIYIDENYKLSRSFFNNDDLQAITFAMAIYDSLTKNNQKDQILNKLSLIAPDFVHLLTTDANEYFVVDLVEAEIDMNDVIYEKINDCFDAEHYLTCLIDGEEFTLAPISYVLRPDGLYLYAFETEYVLIKISKITNLHMTDREFVRDFIPYKKNKHIAVK